MANYPGSRYASAAGPINRRTALRESLANRPVNPLVKQRLQNTRAKQLLGTPLGHQLGQAQPRDRATPGQYALLGMSPILSLAGVWIIWPLSGLAAILSGVFMLVLGISVGLWVLRARVRDHQVEDASHIRPAFDAQVLHQLDQVLEQLAAQVPDATLSRLREIKATLVRIAPLLARSAVTEDFTLDDRLYIIECLRRYLPDTLQAYLDVPAYLRTTSPADDLTPAQVLLNQQLDLLQSELLRREQQLDRSATGLLLQQRRFLQAKQR